MALTTVSILLQRLPLNCCCTKPGRREDQIQEISTKGWQANARLLCSQTKLDLRPQEYTCLKVRVH